MPIGMIATLDPIQQIYSTGWMYRRAISGGRGRLVFWGMWLIFGPGLTLLLAALVSMLLSWSEILRGGFWSWIAAISTLAYNGLVAAVLWRFTASYYRRRREGRELCREGGEAMEGAAESDGANCGEPLASGGDYVTPGDPAWDPPDLSAISDEHYPVHCAVCATRLAGGDADGQCPVCGTAFNRVDRLADAYGPEVFVLDDTAKTPNRNAKDAVRLRRLWIATALALASVVVFEGLVQSGTVPQDRWPFLLLIFALVGLEWFRYFKSTGPSEPPDGE